MRGVQKMKREKKLIWKEERHRAVIYPKRMQSFSWHWQHTHVLQCMEVVIQSKPTEMNY